MKKVERESLEAVHTHTHTHTHSGYYKNNKGITVIALVITIIVLLILAGITLTLVMGENGLIAKAQNAGKEYGEASNNEMNDLNSLGEQIASSREKSGTMEIIFDTETAVASGKLTKSINEFDFVIVMHNSPGGGYFSDIITPGNSKIGLNFATGSFMYGIIDFEDNNFSTNIGYNTGGWGISQYGVKKVIGVKI